MKTVVLSEDEAAKIMLKYNSSNRKISKLKKLNLENYGYLK